MQTLKKYGSWESSISAEQLFDGSININFLRPCAQGLYFVSNQHDRYQLMLLDHQHNVTVISPEEFNLRSSVHEYGAIPYAFSESAVYFVNFDDQRLYQQRHGEAPVALTPASNKELRYADFIVDENNNRLISVREDHRNSGGDSAKVKNTLVAIDLVDGGEGQALYDESDFVGSPVLTLDGRYLCWQTWHHPNMPWDETQLLLAKINADGQLVNRQMIAKDKPGSLMQPLFSLSDDLYFIADWSNWWNIYRLTQQDYQRVEENSLAEKSQPMNEIAAEHATPQWSLGQRNYALIDDERVLLSYCENGLWYLGLLHLETKQLQVLPGVFGEIANVVATAETVFFTATSAHTLVSIYKIDLSSEVDIKINAKAELIYDPTKNAGKVALTLSKNMISVGQAFSFPSGNGQQGYGFFYPPKHEKFKAAEGELPPLLIGIHGGPTSASSSSLKLSTQFWTSRGFAVAEINHRGSSGFGREYRQSLYKNWGLYDLEDTQGGVQYLVNKGLVDASKLAIHGGSAGGYTVMAMLTFYDLFHAGASYYGISDLEALARGTHKFESRYLDQLIGPYPQTKSVYQQRSPINFVENITAPLLILQGLEDKVVPPEQARKIYAEIKDSVADCELIIFDDEGHGFRKKNNQVHALEAELMFYRKVFNI